MHLLFAQFASITRGFAMSIVIITTSSHQWNMIVAYSTGRFDINEWRRDVRSMWPSENLIMATCSWFPTLFYFWWGERILQFHVMTNYTQIVSIWHYCLKVIVYSNSWFSNKRMSGTYISLPVICWNTIEFSFDSRVWIFISLSILKTSFCMWNQEMVTRPYRFRRMFFCRNL